jgi:hypothetical protein
MITVTFINALTGAYEVSRYFDSEKAGRKWSAWLLKQKFVKEVSIYRGPAGGDLIERMAA